MFIDESGEADIKSNDPRFNIFVLCGILFREDCYLHFDAELKKLKQKFFNDTNIVFRSFNMRKKDGRFKIFQDNTILQDFYNDIGKIFIDCDYKIISCVINKEKYKARYPDKNLAYEDALTFLCERAIKYIGIKNKSDTLHICLEKRTKQKDSTLKKVYTSITKYGTQYVSTDSFKMCNPKLFFRAKDQNINGLQLADLCAYPIARKSLTPQSPQPTFDIIEQKFYCNLFGNYMGLGLKKFP
jgi:hypothetical protein